MLLTVLWPGAGHLYLGLTQKAMPYFVANALGVVFVLSIYLSPIGILIWLVTLCMTIGSVTRETNQVNDALRRGLPHKRLVASNAEALTRRSRNE